LLSISNIFRLQPNAGFDEFDEALAVEVSESFKGFLRVWKAGQISSAGLPLLIGLPQS
jgi:hypothetical protein